MLVYMLGLIQGDAEFHGVRATTETIADLLIENLATGGDIRAAVPKALSALEEAGAIMQIDDGWRVQTKEARSGTPPIAPTAWRARQPGGSRQRRRAALDAAFSEALKGLLRSTRPQQRARANLHGFGPGEKPPTDKFVAGLQRLGRNLESGRGRHRRPPDTEADHPPADPIAQEADRLDEALRQRSHRRRCSTPAPLHPHEGEQAQSAMQQREAADRTVREIAEAAVRTPKSSGRRSDNRHLPERPRQGGGPVGVDPPLPTVRRGRRSRVGNRGEARPGRSGGRAQGRRPQRPAEASQCARPSQPARRRP